MKASARNVRLAASLLLLAALVLALTPAVVPGSLAQGGDPWLAEETAAQERALAEGRQPAPSPGAAAPVAAGEPALHDGHLVYDPATGRSLPDPTVREWVAASPEEQAEVDAYSQEKLQGIDPSRITFRSGLTLEPQPGIDPTLLEALAAPGDAAAAGTYSLIQFSYPFPTEARYRLEGAGVVFFDPVDVTGLYARIPPQAVDLLQSLVAEGLVRHVGPIPAAARLDPALVEAAAANPEADNDVILLTFEEPTPAQLEELGAWLAIDARSDGPLHIVEGRAPAASLLALANLAYVRWLEKQPEITLGNLDGGMGIGSDVVHSYDWDGTGVQVMVVDTGIARSGSTYHPDLPAGRILDQYDYQDGDSVANDANSHGTHVAGTIGGRYNDANANSVRSWQGVAPNASFLIYKLCCGTNQFDATWFQQALQRATSGGRTAHVSNNSWGGGNGVYNTYSEMADRAVRGEYNGRRINMVIISHNDNNLTRAPGTGKNVITVGSVKDGNYPDVSFATCGAVNDVDWPPGTRVCYSNYGPIDTDGDGRTRVKPDLMAPGAMISSAVPWYLYGDNRYYGFKDGTSMAAPHVTGAIAQVLQAYTGLLDWPEVVKAMLLATTVDVGANTNLYGRGLIDPFHTIYYQPGVSAQMRFWGDSLPTTNSTKDFTFNVPTGYGEVRIALTWADPAGAAEGIHDLDILSVKDGGGFTRGSAATYDDTVEYVRIGPGFTPGTWTITVKAFSITSPQQFGLAAHPVLVPSGLDIRASAEPAGGGYWYLHQYVANGGYTAAGAYARLYVPAGATVDGVRVYTQDGHSHYYDDTELYHPAGSSYWRVAVGEVLAGYTRHVRWFLSLPPAQPCAPLTFESNAYWTEKGSLYASPQRTNTINCVHLPLVIRRWPPIAIPEGFESGAVPPAGWTLVRSNPRQTWHSASAGPHLGSYFAQVLKDSLGQDQDELLLSRSFAAYSGSVSLWSKGSPSRCRGAIDNCDLEVWFVKGDWGGGDDVYLGQADPTWSGNYTWDPATFDFGAAATGAPARIGLRYTGTDGEEIGVDDVTITYTQ